MEIRQDGTGSDDGTDSIISFDRIVAFDPKVSWGNFDRLPKATRGKINGANSKHIVIYNTPVAPNINGNLFDWTAPNGEIVYVKTFINGFSTEIVNNPSYGGNFKNGENQKHQLRIHANSSDKHQNLVHVFHAGDLLVANLVNSSAGEIAVGISIKNSLVVFNGTENEVADPTPVEGGRARHDKERLGKNAKLRFFKTGFTIVVGAKELVFLDIGVDEALKLIVSGGLLKPR